MGIVESEADAIAWAHQMAKTPTTGDHEVTDPHPYCLGDDPCCCVQLIAACETARADERTKAAERVRVETLREVRAAIQAKRDHWQARAERADEDSMVGRRYRDYFETHDADLAVIARLINAATTGDTDG